MSARYAIYFAPAPDSAWWRFGANWLGRDELRDAALPQPHPPTFTAAEFAAVTQEPRRYGFHATLKAPFTLAPDVSEASLRLRIAQLAASLRAVALGPLMPLYLDGFVALVPTRRQGEVEALAARCVTELDDLRAPPTPQQLARRRPELLDDRGRELLLRYGYPHVLERYRFHMTLSGPVELAVAALIVPHVAPLALRLDREQPLRLDRLCLFRQAHADAPFVRLHDQELPA